MSRLCSAAHSRRFMPECTVAGRQGLLLDGGALPQPMLERLAAARATPAAAEGRKAASPRAKSLIMKILRKDGECGDAELREFAQMHPGIRALRYRNHESSLWTKGGWKGELGRKVLEGKRLPSGFERADLIADEIYAVRTAYGSLCFDLGIDPPTQAEMVEALKAGGELSKSQAAFFRKAAAEDGALQKEIDDLRAWALSLQPEHLRHAWRRAEPNLMTAASVAHNLRFMREPFSEDENNFLFGMLGKPSIGQRDFERLENAFSGDVSLYGDLLERILERIGNPAEPLLEAARSSSEFETLLDFMGAPREHVQARISQSPGFTKPHSALTPDHADNDDAITSISLIIQGGAKTRCVDLDVAFDGVSGHGGASLASRIAKDAFEIASLAGWIRSPEDVRLAVGLADLAIDIEKERYRVLADKAEGDEKTRLARLQSMGTTAAASFIEGGSFHAIHCGDSDCIVVRGADVIFRTKPHGTGNIIWAGLGIGTRTIQINNADSRDDSNPVFLQDGDVVLTLTDGVGDVMCDHEYGLIAARHPGDAAGISAEIVRTADSRKDPYTVYPLACGCQPIPGKDDDMTLIARVVRLGDEKV